MSCHKMMFLVILISMNFITMVTMAETGDERVILIAMDYINPNESDYALDWYLSNVYRDSDMVVLLAVGENHPLNLVRYWTHVHKDSDKVVLLHVPEYHTVVQSPMVMADVTVITDLMQEEEKRIRQFLEVLGQKLKEKKVGGKVKSASGNPGEVIVRVAKEEHASMIVTGTRGMGKIRRTFLGSISDYVIHHSPVPVLVCRHKDHHEQHGKH